MRASQASPFFKRLDSFWSQRPRWQTAVTNQTVCLLARSGAFSTDRLGRVEYFVARMLGQPLSLHAWERMTFNDKIMYRRLRVRDPRFAVFGDKLRTQDYVTERLGEGCVPNVLRVAEQAEAFSDLVGPFVLKANHGSGWVIIVDTPRVLTPGERIQAQSWIAADYATDRREWAYHRARPLLYAEEFLTPGPPPDYKFHVFDGIPKVVQVDIDRFADHRRVFMQPDWVPLGTSRYPLPCDRQPKPPNLDKMLTWASALAENIDFLRVDMYDMGDRVLVGELTCYPGAGRDRFRPKSLDGWLGSQWARP
jgi:TupA-like ATPgrasp